MVHNTDDNGILWYTIPMLLEILWYTIPNLTEDYNNNLY